MTEAISGVNTMDSHVAALVQATTGYLFYASALAPRPARGRCFHSKVDEAAKRFRTRRLVGLLCGPGVGCRDHFYGKAQGDMRVLSRNRTPASFLWDVFS
jgi:hypothetical protein